ncbi:di-N-acetylchitobiase-like [Mya arenaria]|uniref:di-N-acetylchitobiase-like n=1 Tax=Mya arenaria TaxID=6604 RepID=UPI0022DF535B|nr:di-N-acetylchitobiase-like [Mya arenaria]
MPEKDIEAEKPLQKGAREPRGRRCNMGGVDFRWVAACVSLTLIGVAIGYWVVTPIGAGVPPICHCENLRFCERVTDTTRKEVFMFSLRATATDWQHYDWTKVTTVVMVGYLDMGLVCLAHEHGARAVIIGDVSADVFVSPDKRKSWIAKQLDVVDRHFLDGLNFDFESPILPSQFDLRDGYTALVRETRAALVEKFPFAMVSVDVAWGAQGVDERNYDYQGLAAAADFLFVMAYDMQSQIRGSCVAGPNSPFPSVMEGVQSYLNASISPDRLVLGLPWYGYNYSCLALSTENVCSIRAIPFRGVYCSDAAGNEINFNIISSLLESSTSGRLWDEESQTPYFNYEMHGESLQVRYDDPKSLTVKYQYAIDEGLRGVGVWNTEALAYSSQAPRDIWDVHEMWAALPDFHENQPHNHRKQSTRHVGRD